LATFFFFFVFTFLIHADPISEKFADNVDFSARLLICDGFVFFFGKHLKPGLKRLIDLPGTCQGIWKRNSNLAKQSNSSLNQLFGALWRQQIAVKKPLDQPVRRGLGSYQTLLQFSKQLHLVSIGCGHEASRQCF
jgi:hypothetical protein